MIDKLTLDSTAAIAAGMSYGKWKALHPVSPYQERVYTDVETKVCHHCGKTYPVVNRGTKYCGDECRRAVINKRKVEQNRKRRLEREKNNGVGSR